MSHRASSPIKQSLSPERRLLRAAVVVLFLALCGFIGLAWVIDLTN